MLRIWKKTGVCDVLQDNGLLDGNVRIEAQPLTSGGPFTFTVGFSPVKYDRLVEIVDNTESGAGCVVERVYLGPKDFVALGAITLLPPAKNAVIDNLQPKCECGADKVKSHFHSSWCPKH